MSSRWTQEGETGLLDDFDLTITNAFFAPDSRYNNGETTLLQWEGTTDNADVPETNVFFPTGKGWESPDGGKTLEHDSGKEGKWFVKTSLIFRLFQRCTLPVADGGFGIADLLEERGDPLQAAVWIGMIFHMKREKIEFQGLENVNEKMFPNKYLGIVGVASAPAAAAPAAAAPAAPAGETNAAKLARIKAEKAAAADGGGSSLKDQVMTVLNKHTVWDDAQTEALDIPGVMEDDELIGVLMDEQGLWAQSTTPASA